MKLSDYTLKVLENFVSINNGLVIAASNDGPTTIRTIDRTKTMQAETVVPETLPFVSLYDLGQVLQVLSGMQNPDIEFANDHLTIKDEGGSNVKIIYADPALIIQPPEKGYPKSGVTLKFSLTEDALSKILSITKILNLPDLRLFNDERGIVLQALDRKNPDCNTYDVVVSTDKPDGTFEHFMDIALFKMIPGDYTVEIGKAAWFTSAVNTDLVYLMGLKK